MILFNNTSVAAKSQSIALRVKARRLEMNLTQRGLALRSDVNIETYRRFEKSSEISLANLLKIALALNMLDDFDSLFSQQQFEKIEDVLSTKKSKRKRGRKS